MLANMGRGAWSVVRHSVLGYFRGDARGLRNVAQGACTFCAGRDRHEHQGNFFRLERLRRQRSHPCDYSRMERKPSRLVARRRRAYPHSAHAAPLPCDSLQIWRSWRRAIAGGKSRGALPNWVG